MKMIKYLIVIAYFLPLNNMELFAQSISMEVIGSAGNLSSHNSQLDWTIGEMMIDAYSNTNSLSQGIHQGSITITDVKSMDQTISIDLFPNPVITSINVNHEIKGELIYEIRNIKGQKINADILNENDQIDFSNINSGHYFLSFYHNNKLVRTAKVIKIQ